MMDVKKLVIGFLVLAVAAGGAAFIVSNFGSSVAVNNTAIISDAGAAGATTAPANAFLPQQTDPDTDDVTLFGATVDPSSDSSTDAISNDPTNLTNVLAETYLTDLMSANPTGPQDDTNGNADFTPPDDDAVIAQLTGASSTLADVQIPDWDVEADQIPVNITPVVTSDTITSYTTALQDIFNQDFVQTNLESMFNQNSDPSAASYAEPKVQSALQDIAGLKAPQSAVAFQKSLIKVLVYAKNELALAQNDSADPLKTALVFQGESAKYDAAVQDLQTQTQTLSMLKEFAPLAQAPAVTGPMALINNLLGITTAHAQWVVFDPTTFAQILKQYVENLVLQILKNTVIALMQKSVLHWVQGNGVPKFVQNWGTTLVNSFTQSAVAAINSQYQCISQAPFAAQVKLTLGATYQTSNNVCAVQFQNGLSNNLTKFYNNFSNGGGWLTFGQTMQPDNNYYGSVFFGAQTVANTAQNAQNSAQAKLVANQGWIGSEVCANNNGPTTDPGTGCKLGDILNGNGQCQPAGSGTPYAPQGGGGQCANGASPQVLTPGQVTGQVFNSAVDSGSKLTTAANDIAGLLDSFLSSLLNSLATDAITTVSGALNQGLNGGGGGGSSAAPGGGTSIDLQCTVTSDIPSPGDFTFTASGGQIISASGAMTTPSYTWSAPSQAFPMSGTGPTFQVTFNATGTYNILLSDTVDGVSTNCPATY